MDTKLRIDEPVLRTLLWWIYLDDLISLYTKKCFIIDLENLRIFYPYECKLETIIRTVTMYTYIYNYVYIYIYIYRITPYTK